MRGTNSSQRRDVPLTSWSHQPNGYKQTSGQGEQVIRSLVTRSLFARSSLLLRSAPIHGENSSFPSDSLVLNLKFSKVFNSQSTLAVSRWLLLEMLIQFGSDLSLFERAN